MIRHFGPTLDRSRTAPAELADTPPVTAEEIALAEDLIVRMRAELARIGVDA